MLKNEDKKKYLTYVISKLFLQCKAIKALTITIGHALVFTRNLNGTFLKSITE